MIYSPPWMLLKEYIYVCLQHLNYKSQLFHKRNWRCCLLMYPGLEKSTDLKIRRYRTFTIENHNSRSRYDWMEIEPQKKNSREAHKQSLHCLSLLENAGNLLRGSIFHSNLHFKGKILLFLDNEGKSLLHIHFMPNRTSQTPMHIFDHYLFAYIIKALTKGKCFSREILYYHSPVPKIFCFFS